MRTEAENGTEVVEDEMRLVRSLLETEGRRIADIGCGSGAFARRLAFEADAAQVTAIDLPEALPGEDAGTPHRLRFVAGEAEALPLADGAVDLVFMMKSLHHVPAERMDAALKEIARVLAPDGALYVSEPVAEGDFNEIIRHFHDETEVRRQAQQALGRCTALRRERDVRFLVPCRYKDFGDFEARMMRSSTVTTEITPTIHAATRRTFERHTGGDGSFSENRPFHVTVLRKPAN